MTNITTKPDSLQPEAETSVYLFDNWFDPIEAGLCDRVREFIHTMIEGELSDRLFTFTRLPPMIGTRCWTDFHCLEPELHR